MVKRTLNSLTSVMRFYRVTNTKIGVAFATPILLNQNLYLR